MEGSGVTDWLFPEGNVQLGLVCSGELVGGGVDIWGRNMEQALELNVKTSSITMVRICLRLLSISTVAYCIINIFSMEIVYRSSETK
jgi:hypothetical protein